MTLLLDFFEGNVSDLNKGDIVTCKSLKWPWQTHFIADSNDLEKVPLEMHNDLPKFFSCIGLIGKKHALKIGYVHANYWLY